MLKGEDHGLDLYQVQLWKANKYSQHPWLALASTNTSSWLHPWDKIIFGPLKFVKAQISLRTRTVWSVLYCPPNHWIPRNIHVIIVIQQRLWSYCAAAKFAGRSGWLQFAYTPNTHLFLGWIQDYFWGGWGWGGGTIRSNDGTCSTYSYKQAWTNSVDPGCGVWSGSTLFSTHPFILHTFINL